MKLLCLVLFTHTGMSPHDMWNLARDYKPEYYQYYCEFLERELGWDVVNIHDESEILREWGQFVDIEDDSDDGSGHSSEDESTVLVDEYEGYDSDDDDYSDASSELYYDANAPAPVIDLTMDSDDETVGEPSPQRRRLSV